MVDITYVVIAKGRGKHQKCTLHCLQKHSGPFPTFFEPSPRYRGIKQQRGPNVSLVPSFRPKNQRKFFKNFGPRGQIKEIKALYYSN